ncbi:hypothetical protein RUND412_005027 [Rhizina undulata]
MAFPSVQFPLLSSLLALTSKAKSSIPLDLENNTNEKSTSSRLIQASPYTDLPHLLDLDTLTEPYQLMARALTIMRPLTEKYATEPYVAAFNWPEVVAKLYELSEEGSYNFPKTTFYIIVFRSRLPPTTDHEYLGKLDENAHVEAVKSGGLLKYWFQSADANRRNLATCIWRHRDDAVAGGSGPGHRKAMEGVRGLYLEWTAERLAFVVEEGVRKWYIVDWDAAQHL